MPNLDQMVSWLTLLTANEITAQQLTSVLNLADLEEVEARPWARLKRELTINSFAQYSTGSATVTNGSPTVTGSGTAWTVNMIGMFFTCSQPGASSPAVQVVPMLINSVNVFSQTLTLSQPYPLQSGSGAGYRIFPRFYSVPGMQRVIDVRNRISLPRTTHEQIDQLDPYRIFYSSPARSWAPFGRDSDDNALIELWPTETNSTPYSVYGLAGHVDMQNPTDLPAIPGAVVMNKAAAKACEFLYSLRGDPRWVEQRNYYNQRYEAELMKALDSDREEYGVMGQVQDTMGTRRPSLDVIYNVDFESG